MKKSLKLLNFFILFSFTIILFGCGYEPLLGEKYQIYGIEKTNVTGDRRLGQILINNLTVSKTKEKGSNKGIKLFSIFALVLVFMMSLLNFNAVVYLLPYFVLEVYIIKGVL